MSNSKLEELKKGLKNFSITKFEEKEKQKEINIETDFNSLDWNSIFGNSSASTISTAASSGSYNFTSNPSYTFSTSGAGSSYITNNTNNISPGTLQVKGDAEFDGDIKIKGKSLEKLLNSIEDRLSILIPDPAKLEHYEALQKAYQHYKMLEALCATPDKEEK
jgi:hypothetical protein